MTTLEADAHALAETEIRRRWKEAAKTEIGDESKKDFGKAAYALIPAEALQALAELYSIGAAKYSPRGWEAGMDYSRIFSAMMRHAWCWWQGESLDQVDGQHHLIAVAWCAFALFTYELRKSGTDDRP